MANATSPIILDTTGQSIATALQTIATQAQAITDLSALNITASPAELNFCDGVTSNIQTQLNSKVPISSLIDYVYPIGSIYLSVVNNSPQSFLGGTWERIQDTFLLASGTTYDAGEVGGSASHNHTTEASTTGGTAITIDQMPSHAHKVKLYSNSGEVAQNWNTVDNVNQKATWTTAPVEYTGGGQAHTHTQVAVNTDSKSNLPPYLAVYVWKRTA